MPCSSNIPNGGFFLIFYLNLKKFFRFN